MKKIILAMAALIPASGAHAVEILSPESVTVAKCAFSGRPKSGPMECEAEAKLCVRAGSAPAAPPACAQTLKIVCNGNTAFEGRWVPEYVPMPVQYIIEGVTPDPSNPTRIVITPARASASATLTLDHDELHGQCELHYPVARFSE